MNINYLLRRALLILAFGSVMFLFSCNEDEDPVDPVDPPVAAFTFAVNNDTGAVTFTNNSTGDGNTYEWSFGDGTSSTEAAPTKTYMESGDYTVRLTATNDGGADFDEQTVTVALTTTVTDTEAPVIALTGDAEVEINVGDTYTDAGATATDNVDGTITVTVGGDMVDTSKAGTYVITYNVSDAAGNDAVEVTRTVRVRLNSGLLTNGDFEGTSTDPWFVNFGEGTPPPVPVMKDGTNSFFEVNVSGSNPAEPFQVNLSQVLTIEEGATYELSFDASTGDGQSRTILAGIGLNEAPFTNVTATIDLVTESTRFTESFVANAGGTNSRVLFDLNGADGVVVLDNIVLIKTADAPTANAELPLDFETADDEFGVFNGASFAIVANPDDAGDMVGQITNVGAAFEGIALDLGTPVDFTTDKEIVMQFNSSVGVPVLLKFEGDGAPVEVSVNSDASGWQELTFDFSTVGATGSFSTIVLFVDGPGTSTGTFLIDDITQPSSGGGGGGGNEGGCTETLTAATVLPVDFEGCETFLSSQNFGAGISSMIAANPSKDATNGSDYALKVDRATGGNRFAGIQNAFPIDANPLDFTNNVLKLKIYSSKASTVFRFELALNPQTEPVTGNPAPVFVTVDDANTWTEVEVEFNTAAFPSGSPDTYNQLVIKPDNPNGTDGETNASDETFYFDDITVGPSSGGGGGAPSSYCNTEIQHFGGNVGSEARLTIESVTRGDGFPALKFTIAADPTNGKTPDALTINSFEGGNGLEAPDTSVPGEISIQAFWPSGAPPNNETLFNVLWSFDGEPETWQLFETITDVRVPLDASCE